METLAIVFKRLEGTTRESFCQHYIDVHAPMARRWARTFRRYAVNVKDLDQAPVAGLSTDASEWAELDAFTLVDVESIDDFFKLERTFADPAHAEAMWADHQSFIGPTFMYRVTEQVLAHETGAWPDGERSPGTICLWMVMAGDGSGSAPTDGSAGAGDHPALRHVRWDVVEALTPDAPPLVAFTEVRVASDHELARWATPDGPPGLPTEAGATWSVHLLSEHIQISRDA